MKHFIYAIALIALPLAFGCKKKKIDTPAASTDTVRLKIEHVWQDSIDFVLNETYVHPVTGDSLMFTTLKYYISNIRLKKADGTWWVQPNSYFLMDLATGNTPSVELTNVPYGEYTDVEYVLGVDSARNVSGAQTDALSPSMDMFWSWNTGYIMLKAEGISPDAAGGSFAYHLGGFSGSNSVVTTRTHNFVGNSLSVTGNGNCQIHLSASPENLWTTIGSVSNLSSIHMPGSSAHTVATDFFGTISFEHIHE